MATFEKYLSAAYPIVWVSTPEPERVQRELFKIANQLQPGKTHYRWDILTGLAPLVLTENTLRGYELGKAESCPNPIQAVTKSSDRDGGVTFLWNAHKYLHMPECIQAFQNSVN